MSADDDDRRQALTKGENWTIDLRPLLELSISIASRYSMSENPAIDRGTRGKVGSARIGLKTLEKEREDDNGEACNGDGCRLDERCGAEPAKHGRRKNRS